MKILITRQWPEPTISKIRKQFPETTVRDHSQPMDLAETVSALSSYDIIAPTLGDCFDKEAFDQASKTKKIKTGLIANFGVGYEHVDVDAASNYGIKVTNTPDVLTNATAEIALLCMLMCSRKIEDAQTMLNSPTGWEGWSPTQLMGKGLNGKKLGIVGMGRIGKEVARRAYLAFGMDILFYNRSAKIGFIGFDATQINDLGDLCKKSDFVSLHLPSTAETKNLIDRKCIELIGPKGVLINTARGDLVDETAVMDALDCGKLAGAGLDVFQGEPQINPRWFQTPRAFLLPHIGSATIETRNAMATKAFDNMKAFVEGQLLPNQVVS